MKSVLLLLALAAATTTSALSSPPATGPSTSNAFLPSQRRRALPPLQQHKWLLHARGGASYNQGYGRGGYPADDDYYGDAGAGGYGDDGYADDGYGYRPPPPPPPRGRRGAPSSSSSSRGRAGRGGPTSGSGPSSFGSLINEPMPPSLKRMGFTLLGASLVLTAMGISLFFERNLLRLGNLCLILGLPLYFGPGRVMRLLFAREKLRASICFCLGVFLVLRGNSFFGMLLEIFGFFNLFANFFPVVLALLRNVPLVGDLLKKPEGGGGGGGGRGSFYEQRGSGGRGSYGSGYDDDRW